MDSLQEIRQEFSSLLESGETLDPPHSTESNIEKLRRKLDELKRQDREREQVQKQQEQERIYSEFPSREAYLLHCTMDAYKRTIADFEKTLSPEDAAELKRATNRNYQCKPIPGEKSA